MISTNSIVDSILCDGSTSEPDELYAILGCAKTATIPQILAEYRARVRDFHPDTSDSAASEPKHTNERFIKLQQAKEILTDDRKKRIYDQWLNSSLAIPWRVWMDNSELRKVNGNCAIC
ncbi:unnamed protein product [Anisakis simplex]|uniref:DnaJ homolog subfamily C member 12 (inferred by orthology to a human protein) n=1 Tax=Anisakis simplex TaxID=6269 RepID=A0A0M3J9G3_ANISI|nr:unnamed protein product [Anisakis simplex]